MQLKVERRVLGIEFGSTRIKAVLIGEDHTPIASGSYDWENQYENGIWTYSLEDVWTGLQESYRKLSNEVFEKYNTPLQTIGAIGFSGMMHGYMAFDKDGNLLVPVSYMAQHHNRAGSRGTHGSVPIQHSPALEHCPPLSGDIEQRTPCQGYQLSDHAGRLCPLETDGAKGVGHWRSIGHVPHRQQDQRLRYSA